MKRFFLMLAASLLPFSSAMAAITVDGTLDVDYGAAVAVQTVDTQFGDANPPTVLGGSELDAAYAKIDGGRLYLMFTGNHEPNFNKLEVFIDSVAGGENTLSSTPQYDFQSGATSWNSQNLGGMVLDAGFTVDYHLFSRWGGTETPNQPGGYETDFVNRQGGTSAQVPGSSETSAAPVGLIRSGFIPAGDLGPNASVSALSQNLEFAINDSNQDGVFGGTGAADQVAAAAVTTGMEFSIALADLGNPAGGSQIKIMAVINNGDHSYLSNQFLGGLTAPQGNLGGDGAGGFDGNLDAINMNNFAGNQFFTVTLPAPVFIDGDYNHDHKVDSADYVLWRKLNINGAAGYTTWVQHYGESNMGGGGGAGGVPEPGALFLAFVAVAAMGLVRRK